MRDANRSTMGRFIEPMLCLAMNTLPEGPAWQYELKLDGYRGIGLKSQGRSQVFSRNGTNFNQRFASIARALEALPDETVIDGEIVAMNEAGLPSFNLLQNFDSAGQTIRFYVFDLLMLSGRDLRQRSLMERRKHLANLIKTLPDPIRLSETFDVPVDELVRVVRQQGLEGVVAKRNASSYRSGDRSGDWVKMRINRGQEFVIGGYLGGRVCFQLNLAKLA
jgi:ATP-dependent DNA ligase